jgi:hypothetical protein
VLYTHRNLGRYKNVSMFYKLRFLSNQQFANNVADCRLPEYTTHAHLIKWLIGINPFRMALTI